MTFHDSLTAYNAHRKASPHSLICQAPFLNLHFLQTGMVTACCFKRPRGRPIVFRSCVMRSNWAEVPQILEFCNDQEALVMLTPIDTPIGLALHTLTTSEIREITD